MKTEELYNDLEQKEFEIAMKVHEEVKELLTVDDLVSIVVCDLLEIDNHSEVEDKLNCIAHDYNLEDF